MNKKKKLADIEMVKLAKYSLLSLLFLSLFFVFRLVLENLDNPKLISIIVVLPFIFFLFPYLVIALYQIKSVGSKMQVVPRFLRDVVDNFESGMDLISSIKSTKDNEYGILNGDILKFVNQLSWGIDFDKAFTNFANNIGSPTLKRDIRLIIEAKRVGGHVEKILREVSYKILDENVRAQERKSNLASNTFTGYISFLIFLLIIILVYNNLFVELNQSVTESSGQETIDDGKMAVFLSLIILLSYELAVLSGFLFGLMQENNIFSGSPHIVILVVITFLSYFFFV